ncbi:hypothetical protein AL036_15750 [Salipiger aestuarii]|uniref:LPS sulfotransferase NodH n=1 Tax=Salipiger aestuarii TaxID=568098 RepID=A0A327XHE4_9RHOB|nr:hypothetical protein [Salipiger aestuarii]EIE51111.1 hypothetical protein C357_10432 [Citreicella sp. 357]KAA8606129.1 hypothetical protein AL036_15750 [Salipiger aestuarii]KAA8606238.1 hypothetical protein AL037_20655 [Salipiger aestuarii]KAB2532701.1 hypothetical protein AL035_21015 [Salipiger aestuarii]RAK07812.1 hypothetical protein ATI53_10913 [Salipiger aestuarii]
MPERPMPERPWLILTLRRTGGTSLTAFLAEISPFPSIEHEPFNIDRTFGHVTRAFRDSGDAEALRAGIDAALGDDPAQRPNIKHCFDVVPPALTAELIRACAARGYAVLLYTRGDEARRLRSLFLALSTGAWGGVEARRIYPEIRAGRLQPKPIDPVNVRRRVTEDRYRLARVIRQLDQDGIAHSRRRFEDIYGPGKSAPDEARRLAAELGTRVAPDARALRWFDASQKQGSEDIAGHVPGYPQAVALLDKLCHSGAKQDL